MVDSLTSDPVAFVLKRLSRAAEIDPYSDNTLVVPTRENVRGIIGARVAYNSTEIERSIGGLRLLCPR
jgi:hypothetical protein